jgi:hypothetical protein
MYIYPKHPAHLYRPILNWYRLTCPRVQLPEPVPFDCDLGFRYRLLKMELKYMCGCHIYFIFQSLSNFDHRKCLKLSLAYEYMKLIIKCKKILQRLSVSDSKALHVSRKYHFSGLQKCIPWNSTIIFPPESFRFQFQIHRGYRFEKCSETKRDIAISQQV